MERTLKEGNFSLSRAGEGAMGGRGQGWSDRGDFGPNALFCNFYRTQVSLGSGLWVPVSLCLYVQELCENFTDVTLADVDTKLILSDDANKVTPALVSTHGFVVPLTMFDSNITYITQSLTGSASLDLGLWSTVGLLPSRPAQVPWQENKVTSEQIFAIHFIRFGSPLHSCGIKI